VNQVDLGAEALLSLGIVSTLAGVAMVYVFRRWSDQYALRVTANRMLAHLMEFRLFVDEPTLVMRAQRDLFVENWRLLRLLARPSLILIVPCIVLLAQMDACYGRAPLRIGAVAIVTVQFKNPGEAARSGITLKSPPAIRIETPGVRIVRVNQISWRIRPSARSSGELLVIGPDRAVTKTITAGSGVHYLSERRVSSLPTFFLHLNEPPLIDPSIASIEVLYPSATILRWHWLVWFFAISSGSAILIHAVPRTIQRIVG
jgi:hypothetical protein